LLLEIENEVRTREGGYWNWERKWERNGTKWNDDEDGSLSQQYVIFLCKITV